MKSLLILKSGTIKIDTTKITPIKPKKAKPILADITKDLGAISIPKCIATRL